MKDACEGTGLDGRGCLAAGILTESLTVKGPNTSSWLVSADADALLNVALSSGWLYPRPGHPLLALPCFSISTALCWFGRDCRSRLIR